MPFYTQPGGNPFGPSTRARRKDNPFLTSLLGPDFRIPPFNDPFVPPPPDDTLNPFPPPPPSDVNLTPEQEAEFRRQRDARRRSQRPPQQRRQRPPPTFPTLDSPLSQEFFSRNPGAALFAVFRDLLSGPPTPLSRFLLSRADDLQNTYASVLPLDPGLQFIDFLKKGASVPTLLKRVPREGPPEEGDAEGIVAPPGVSAGTETLESRTRAEAQLKRTIADLETPITNLRARLASSSLSRREGRQVESLLNHYLEQIAQSRALLEALKSREVLREGVEIGPFQPQEEFRRLAPSQRGESPSRFAPRAIYRF